MDAKRIGRDSVPYEISKIGVEGCARLFYQLEDLDWMILFTPSDSDHLTKAFNSMDRADPKEVLSIVRGDNPEWLWSYVGLRPEVKILLAEDPGEEDGFLSMEEAAELSESVFGLQKNAPALKRSKRGKLQEVKGSRPKAKPALKKVDPGDREDNSTESLEEAMKRVDSPVGDESPNLSGEGGGADVGSPSAVEGVGEPHPAEGGGAE